MNQVNLEKIINNFKKYHKRKIKNLSLIQKAYVYAVLKHGKQQRKSGDLYISHPLEVAYIVSSMGMDETSIAAALLHDVVEDTNSSTEEIEANFGKNVSKLVDGLTKLKRSSAERTERSFLKLATVFCEEDQRVMVIKFADRLHNMRTLDGIKNEQKREKIAKDTIEVFAPFAEKLGIRDISEELFDLSLKYYDNKNYNIILKHLFGIKNELRPHLEKAVSEIKKILLKNNLKFEIFTKFKSTYEIYKEIAGNERLGVEDIMKFIDKSYNFFTVDILTKNLNEVYKTVFILHKNFPYLPNGMEDHINSKEFGGDRYLKTILTTKDKDNNSIYFEVRIRTFEMYKIYREGLTAFYKPMKKTFKNKEWIEKFIEKIKDEIKSGGYENIKEKYESIKDTAKTDFIRVYTLKRKNFQKIPKNSTLLDFAYSISSELGDHFKMAQVNDKIVFDPKYILRDLDSVLIIKDENPMVNSTWLSIVKTSKAKKSIKRAVRKNIMDRGEKILKKRLKKKNINFEEFEEWLSKNKNIINNFLGKIYDIKNFFYFVGVDPFYIEKVLLLYDEYNKVEKGKNLAKALKESYKKFYKNIKPIKSPTLQLSEEFLRFYPYCPICMPIRGEESILIKRNDEFEIHSKSCSVYKDWYEKNIGNKNINGKNNSKYPINIKKIKWPSINSIENRFRLKILLEAEDKEKLLSSISNVTSRKGVSILENQATVSPFCYNGKIKVVANVHVLMDIENVSTLENVLKDFNKFKEIKKIECIRTGFFGSVK